MISFVRRANWRTASRVTLVGLVAIIAMLVLILHAETELAAAFEKAIAVHKVDNPPAAPAGCDAKKLRALKSRPQSFDGRALGYTTATGRTILCLMWAAGGDGKAAYLDRHFPLDMVFPVLYGPAFAMLWLYLLITIAKRHTAWRFGALVPLAGAALDIAENITVRGLVLAGPQGDLAMVETASLLTVTKYALVSVSALATIPWLFYHLARNARLCGRSQK